MLHAFCGKQVKPWCARAVICFVIQLHYAAFIYDMAGRIQSGPLAGGGPQTTFRKRRGLELFTMLYPCINPPPRTEENVLDEKVSSCS